MSKRAKEKAWKVYPKRPEQIYITAFGTIEFDHDASNRQGFIKGYELAEKDLGWHSVDESLPPVDEEVIVLTDIIAEDSIKIGLGRICFAHIVNPELTVGVGNISYTPISYSGWNIPGVKYWMPMPKLPNEDD